MLGEYAEALEGKSSELRWYLYPLVSPRAANLQLENLVESIGKSSLLAHRERSSRVRGTRGTRWAVGASAGGKDHAAREVRFAKAHDGDRGALATKPLCHFSLQGRDLRRVATLSIGIKIRPWPGARFPLSLRCFSAALE